jgi:hypothetical protein
MIWLKAPLQRFTVRETSPGVNHGEPDKPLYWHWSVEGRSAVEAQAHTPERKSRGLALPTGRGGRSFKVVGPLAKMQFVGRSDLLLGFRHRPDSRLQMNDPKEGGR